MLNHAAKHRQWKYKYFAAKYWIAQYPAAINHNYEE